VLFKLDGQLTRHPINCEFDMFCALQPRIPKSTFLEGIIEDLPTSHTKISICFRTPLIYTHTHTHTHTHISSECRCIWLRHNDTDSCRYRDRFAHITNEFASTCSWRVHVSSRWWLLSDFCMSSEKSAQIMAPWFVKSIFTTSGWHCICYGCSLASLL
jgi:hypothetical protein